MRLAGTKLAANHQYRGFGDQLYDLSGQRPSLDLQFADRKDLVDATTGQNLVTFTRASSGTYVDSQGVIKTAVTNLFTRSEEFGTGWTLQNVTLAENTISAPNGTVTADTVTDATAGSGANHRIHLTSISATAGVACTASFYVKNIGATWVHIRDGSNAASCWFNISNQTIGTNGLSSTASIQSVGDGWLRLSVTWTPSATSTSVGIGFAPANGTATYTTSTGGSLYLWGAQLEQSSTVGEYIPTTSTINSAPRFDHDPTTGESLGLLVEEQRANSIRNNTMVGAVAGTPGTAPTNWIIPSASGNLTTREIVGIGTENGIAYIDVRFVASGVLDISIYPEPGNQVAASNGQAWTHSAYVKLVGGSVTNLTTRLGVVENNSSGNFLTGGAVVYTPTLSTLKDQRINFSHTNTNASTSFVQPRLRFEFSGAGDITLRIGLPQLEQGAFATSVIPTTTAAVTRAADVASISGSNFSSWYRQDEGTIYAEGSVPVGVSGARALAGISDGTNNERILIGHNGTTAANGLVVDGNVVQFSSATVANGFPPGERRRLALAYKTDDFGFVNQGSTPDQDSSGTLPTPTQLQIGNAPGRTEPNAPIRRLTYWPSRLPNSTLQNITR